MAEKIIDNKTGKLLKLEFSVDEMANDVLEIDRNKLLSLKKILPPTKGAGDKSIYSFSKKSELDLFKKRASLLKTGMNETAVLNVEKMGLLNAYSELAKDCPEGITAHVWRSYGFVVLMQVRKNMKVNAAQLAKGANINSRDKNGKVVANPEMAGKHLRLLQGLGYLTETEERWEHQGLPLFWQDKD